MQVCYVFFVKRKTPYAIDCILVPDLSLRIAGDELLSIEQIGLHKFISDKIIASIEQRIALKLPIKPPRALSEYKDRARNTHDFHSYVLIDMEKKLRKGFFSKLFPIFGGLSSLVSIVCNTIISMVSMQVITAGVTNREARSAFSIAESLLASLYNVIIYFSSPANSALSQLGDKIDNSSCHKKNPEQLIVRSPRSCCASTKIILTQTALVGLAANYLVNGAIVYFQELEGLGDKARETHSTIDPDLFDVIKWITVVTNSMALLSFYFSFIQNALNNIEKYFTGEPEIAMNEWVEDESVDEEKAVPEDDIEQDTQSLFSKSSP